MWVGGLGGRLLEDARRGFVSKQSSDEGRKGLERLGLLLLGHGTPAGPPPTLATCDKPCNLNLK